MSVKKLHFTFTLWPKMCNKEAYFLLLPQWAEFTLFYNYKNQKQIAYNVWDSGQISWECFIDSWLMHIEKEKSSLSRVCIDNTKWTKN